MIILILIPEERQANLVKNMEFKQISYNKSVLFTRKFISSQFSHSLSSQFTSGNEYSVICYDDLDIKPEGIRDTENVYHIDGIDAAITCALSLSETVYIFSHQSIFYEALDIVDEVWIEKYHESLSKIDGSPISLTSELIGDIKSLGLKRYQIFHDDELIKGNKFRTILENEYENKILPKKESKKQSKLLALLGQELPDEPDEKSGMRMRVLDKDIQLQSSGQYIFDEPITVNESDTYSIEINAQIETPYIGEITLKINRNGIDSNDGQIMSDIMNSHMSIQNIQVLDSNDTINARISINSGFSRPLQGFMSSHASRITSNITIARVKGGLAGAQSAQSVYGLTGPSGMTGPAGIAYGQTGGSTMPSGITGPSGMTGMTGQGQPTREAQSRIGIGSTTPFNVFSVVNGNNEVFTIDNESSAAFIGNVNIAGSLTLNGQPLVVNRNNDAFPVERTSKTIYDKIKRLYSKCVQQILKAVIYVLKLLFCDRKTDDDRRST